jgi:hypothetical protein
MSVESKPAFSASWRGMTSRARAKAATTSCCLPAMVRLYLRVPTGRGGGGGRRAGHKNVRVTKVGFQEGRLKQVVRLKRGTPA